MASVKHWIKQNVARNLSPMDKAKYMFNKGVSNIKSNVKGLLPQKTIPQKIAGYAVQAKTVPKKIYNTLTANKNAILKQGAKAIGIGALGALGSYGISKLIIDSKDKDKPKQDDIKAAAIQVRSHFTLLIMAGWVKNQVKGAAKGAIYNEYRGISKKLKDKIPEYLDKGKVLVLSKGNEYLNKGRDYISNKLNNLVDKGYYKLHNGLGTAHGWIDSKAKVKLYL